jgi:hypothetical protein
VQRLPCRVLAVQAGGRPRILCSELARGPLVLVVCGVSGSQEGHGLTVRAAHVPPVPWLEQAGVG